MGNDPEAAAPPSENVLRCLLVARGGGDRERTRLRTRFSAFDGQKVREVGPDHLDFQLVPHLSRQSGWSISQTHLHRVQPIRTQHWLSGWGFRNISSGPCRGIVAVSVLDVAVGGAIEPISVAAGSVLASA